MSAAKRVRVRACRQGMPCSADTIVRLVRRAALPTVPPVKVLGVDEWGATRSYRCSCKNSRKEDLTWGSAPKCSTLAESSAPGTM